MAEQLDDELPQAPTSDTPPGTTVSFSGEGDADVFADVPKLGDALPPGTASVRLKSFKEGKNDSGPFFSLIWVITQEPNPGHALFDNYVEWCSPETFAAAKAGDPSARADVSKRLQRIKAIMEAASFKPTGKFDVKEFLGSNPEIKVTYNVSEKKQKVNGVYTGTGEMENRITKYISLAAPR